MSPTPHAALLDRAEANLDKNFFKATTMRPLDFIIDGPIALHIGVRCGKHLKFLSASPSNGRPTFAKDCLGPFADLESRKMNGRKVRIALKKSATTFLVRFFRISFQQCPVVETAFRELKATEMPFYN